MIKIKNNKIIDLKNIKLIKDKNTGNLMGYGFLEFYTKEEAEMALEKLNGTPMPNTDNKKVYKLNWASYSQSSKQNNNSNQNANEYSIYVCELDQSITETILKDFFSQYYKSIIGTKIIVDPSTKISKGYGFVKFSDQEEAQKALNEMNGQQINGKKMKTGKAQFKKNNNNNNNNNLNNKDNKNLNNNLNSNNNNLNNLSSLYSLYYPNNPNDLLNCNFDQQSLLLQQQQLLNSYYMYQNMSNPYYQMYSNYFGQQQMEQQKANENVEEEMKNKNSGRNNNNM